MTLWRLSIMPQGIGEVTPWIEGVPARETADFGVISTTLQLAELSGCEGLQPVLLGPHLLHARWYNA